MRRLLQKHGKIIMTVVGIVLMLVFALPAFNAAPDSSTLTAGRLNGKKITNNDVAVAGQDLQILERCLNQEIDPLLGLDERNPALNWYLLLQDAKRYGFDSVTLAPDAMAAQLQASAMASPDISKWVTDSGLPSRAIDAAFLHLQMFIDLRAFAMNLPQPLSGVELAADRNFTRLKVTFAAFNAASDWQTIPAPADEQINNQFLLYKGVLHTPLPASATAPLPPLPPLIAGHHFPFGYKYPDRVAVEYLKLDRAAIRALFKPTQEDYTDAYKYYREHLEDPAFQNTPPTTTSSTAPAPPASQPTTKPFEAVQENLVNQQIDQRVDRQLKRISDRIRSVAAEPWKQTATDDKGYRAALAADKWAGYAKIADDIAKNRDFDGYRPEYHAATGLEGAEELAALPGIGSAFFKPSNQQSPIPFPLLATQVHELVDLSAKDLIGRMSLQVGIEGPDPIQDEEGNFYIYRVTRVEKSHDPASVEEVRPQVIDDLKKFINYQRLEAQARELAASANHGDLTALAGAKSIPVQTPPEFNHVAAEAPAEIDGIRDFIDTAFSLLPGSAGSRPATEPQGAATQSSGVGATTTLDNDSTLKAYVLQLRSVSPVSPAEFASAIRDPESRQNFTFLYQPISDIAAFAKSWFSLETLAARVHFVPTTPFAAKKDTTS